MEEVRQRTNVAADVCPGCHEHVSERICAHCGAVSSVGEYRILELIAQTGHGRMYLAEGPGGRVALKELVFASVPSEAQLASFRREAELLRQLQHPRIPRFLESFEEGAGVQKRLYLAQTHVEGVSLEKSLADWRFNEVEALGIARQVLEVLVYLQGLSPRILHRDIKPSNLILQPDGTVFVVDFGSARDNLVGSLGATLDIGTYAYMPPEQLGGEVGPTSDVFALGKTLLNLLGRKPPKEVVIDALGVSEGTKALLEQMTAPLEERFPDAAAALRALDAPEKIARGVARKQRRSRRVRNLAVAAIATAILGAVGLKIAAPYLPWAAWAVRIATQYGSSGHDWKPIHHAAEAGDTAEMQRLLDGGALVNARTGNGVTPLHIAAFHDDARMVRFLLEHGAFADAQDDDATTPLHLAAEQGSLHAIRALLDAGASIEAAKKDAVRPLWTAAASGNAETVALLLDRGAQVDAASADGTTPLHEAVFKSNIAVIEVLLRHGADPLKHADSNAELGPPTLSIPNWTPVDVARHIGNARVIELLSAPPR